MLLFVIQEILMALLMDTFLSQLNLPTKKVTWMLKIIHLAK